QRKISEQQTHLQVQAKFSHFASELKPGSPCPLCGALEHPEPMMSHQAKNELEHLAQAWDQLEQQRAGFQIVKSKLTRASITIQTRSASFDQLQADLQTLSQEMNVHNSKFNWSGYSADDMGAFESKKTMIKQNEERNIQLEDEIRQIREHIESNQDNIQRFQKELENIQAEKAVVQGVRLHAVKALRQLDVREFEDKSLEEIHKEKVQLSKHILQIESSYVDLNRELNTVKTKLAEIAGQYGAAKDQLSHYNQQIKSRQERIAQLLREFQLADITQVQQILQRPMAVERIRQEIQQYFVKLEVMDTQIGSLQEFLKNKQFSEEELETTTKLFEFKKEELELQLALTGGLEKELAHITLEYGKKEKLVEEFEQINNRGANLKVLENLFKGNGFVNYVSSIHLRQMCEIANERFHRLTRNQLSLTLNENNEFEVVDYLNNGYRRSVKTLSGGQSFQASLCLALALAESIQSLNKADRNFFFIDEGFGTQDPESIDTVFDTLQYLHQENRVVGIISHVEELKERIPRSITVVKDAEQGSKLRPSWA
ncbi:MAG: SbcC/MukB-like Walker B domain-containing protein, partial [Sphingobacteriaceae bacterium]